MAAVTVKTVAGKDAGSLELAADMFGIQPNVPVMHQVITAQLAARRAGTQSTKTRAEVRGGGKKPFKQKGTGNARQGSTRAPHFSGGGVALGPKPRKYTQKTPKKMIKLALRSALSDRAAEGRILIVDEWAFSAPKTKDAVAALSALGIAGDKALVVVDIADTNTIKSFLNLPEVQLIERAELNAYDVLCNDWIVFTRSTLPAGAEGTDAIAPAGVKRFAESDAAAAVEEGASDEEVAESAAADVLDELGGDEQVSRSAEVATGDEGSASDESQAARGESGADERPDSAAASVEPQPDAAESGADDEPAIEDGTDQLPKGAVPANEDGSSPYKSYAIKGNAESGYYHTPESPYYERTAAEFWFRDEEAAKAAGFELPPSLRDDDETEQS